jgi:hypothetical protein
VPGCGDPGGVCGILTVPDDGGGIGSKPDASGGHDAAPEPFDGSAPCHPCGVVVGLLPQPGH